MRQSSQTSLWLIAMALAIVFAVPACAAGNSKEQQDMTSADIRNELRLPACIGDNMVLQRDKPVPIWGWDRPGQKVAVLFGRATREATAAVDGRWRVDLPPHKASAKPVVMKISGSGSLSITNILVGEVWLCAGQSNMGWALEDANDATQAISSADSPLIRMYTSPKYGNGKPYDNEGRAWFLCNEKTVRKFSAVAYYYARELQKKLNVPIGLIAAYGVGNLIEAFTSPEGLTSDPAIKAVADKYAQWQSNPYNDPNTPAALYKILVEPVVPYGLRGVIWYQGESNVGNAYMYRKLFPNLIADWRAKWNAGDLPFYFVQLANCGEIKDQPGESSRAELREAQFMALRVKNTGMATAVDLGDPADLHPRNKKDVGLRLSHVALANTYGMKHLAWSGPLYRRMTIEGSNVRLSFDHIEGGLVAKGGGKLQGFAIADDSRRFVWADAVIDGETVVVSSKEAVKPAAVRYGWAESPVSTLYNKAGLPASPFRTDDWPGVTGPQ